MRNNWMRKYSGLMAVLLLVAAMLTGCGKGNETPEEKAGNTAATEQSVKAQEVSKGESSTEDGLLTGKHYVDIHMKDSGTIRVELDADSAPITVTNFVNLVKDGFYDGLTFHRIIAGFMMQGGDPTGTGAGGSQNTIKGEFAANGVDNPLSHTRGAISMARTDDPNSASSQFFIMHQDGPSLDGSYAAFGYVIAGMEVVDEICENATGQDRNGILPAENRPVIESMEYIGQ